VIRFNLKKKKIKKDSIFYGVVCVILWQDYGLVKMFLVIGKQSAVFRTIVVEIRRVVVGNI
jgi:hypothetical protein